MKKTFKYFSLILLTLILTACGAVSDSDDFNEKMKKEGMEISSIKTNTYFKLGIEGVKESSFKNKNNDEIIIYEFNDDVKLEEIKSQFLNQLSISKKSSKPVFYSNDNILIIHLPISENENVEKQFDNVLKKFKKSE